jgi:hypothetical protein
MLVAIMGPSSARGEIGTTRSIGTMMSLQAIRAARWPPAECPVTTSRPGRRVAANQTARAISAVISESLAFGASV